MARERQESLVKALYIEDKEEKAKRKARENAKELKKLQRQLKSVKAEIVKLRENPEGFMTAVKKRRLGMEPVCKKAVPLKKAKVPVKTAEDAELARLKKDCKQGKEWNGGNDGPEIV